MSVDDQSDIARLKRLLGGAELGELRRRLRARYRRGASAGEFTLTRLSSAERRALEGLLGRTVSGAESMRLRSSELDNAVSRAGLAPDLRSALELLDGPLQNLKAQRAAWEQAWNAMLSAIQESRLIALTSTAAGALLLKRLSGSDLARARSLIEGAERVLARIPAQGLPLGQLAAEALGDSHALDAGRAVATIVLRCCSHLDHTETEERTREQWARLGIAVNELAWPALCLNLPVSKHTDAPFHEPGEPLYLSLRRLLRQPPKWEVGHREVFVCENPNIVSIAADRLGVRSAPLVCTDGMPSASQRVLLTQLARAGARLRYHGDFDWAGLSIGNFVVNAFAATPWRFGTADYLAAGGDVILELAVERRVEAQWDSLLAPAMAERGSVVHEEVVAETLLADLAIAAV